MTSEKPAGVEIPWQNLSSEALLGVIDDFILREGTDYGSVEATLDKKRTDLLRQLENKKIRLFFDPETETITLVPTP